MLMEKSCEFCNKEKFMAKTKDINKFQDKKSSFISLIKLIIISLSIKKYI